MCYILKTARLTVSLSLLSCSRLDAATFNTPVIGPDELSVVVAGVLKSRSSLLWPLRGVGSYSEGVNPPPPELLTVERTPAWCPVLAASQDLNRTRRSLHSGLELPSPDPGPEGGMGSFLVLWFLLFF